MVTKNFAGSCSRLCMEPGRDFNSIQTVCFQIIFFDSSSWTSL